MFVPASFPRASRPVIRACLFGCPDPKPAAIITPLHRVYDGVTPNGISAKGWWHTRHQDNVLVVLSPQGSPALDVISALEPDTEVTFVGFAGSSGGMPVGSIIEAQSAEFSAEGHKYPRTFKAPLMFTAGDFVSVGCLAESLARSTMRPSAKYVDMETALIYATCEKKKKPARSIQIVSDDFKENPFYAPSAPSLDESIALVCRFLTRYAVSVKSSEGKRQIR